MSIKSSLLALAFLGASSLVSSALAGGQYAACFSANGAYGTIQFIKSGNGFTSVTKIGGGKFERVGQDEFLYVYTYQGKRTTNLLAIKEGGSGIKVLSSGQAEDLAKKRGGLKVQKFRWRKC